MNTIAFIFTTLFALSFSITDEEYQNEWARWKEAHNKVYPSSAEHTYRFGVFKNSMDFVMSHNAEEAGFTVALNKFADQTSEEFTSWACGMNITAQPRSGSIRLGAHIAVPSSWDWRSHGAVTKVKDQGQCGSCWSFSTTGSTEAAHYLKTKSLVSLSEQNLVDCSTRFGNQGCNGGLMDNAFKYIIYNKGIDSESSYPYTATGPNRCKFNKDNVAATLSSFKDIPSGDENSLMTAVYSTPVSVAIDASRMSFQLYSGGVYYDSGCSSSRLDHGVLAVGYGTESGKDYWLVKNSWGASWGESGYIKMTRNRHNNCGIATSASYPIA